MTVRPLSFYKELTESTRLRQQHGFFLVEGRRATDQIIAAGVDVDEILVCEADSHFQTEFPRRILTGRQFKSICTSKTPAGIAAVIKLPALVYSDRLPEEEIVLNSPRLLLLDGVQDPGNVGTLVRTAVAFGYGGVIMSDSCADPFSPKAIQASAGSVLSLWIRRTGKYLECAADVKRRKYDLVAADVRGEALSGAIKAPHMLLFGSEGNGLSEKTLALADWKLRIPINHQNIESLNVAVSGAIMMFLGRNS
ncbi:MAG: RNA methyltransferase [Chitinispirillaceae bacterium]|nr:RNA methyltransferase [Chitinispirillaceae bacterium]